MVPLPSRERSARPPTPLPPGSPQLFQKKLRAPPDTMCRDSADLGLVCQPCRLILGHVQLISTPLLASTSVHQD